MREDLVFRSDGKEAPGKGSLTVHSQTKRAALASILGGVGLLGGLATLVPGPHMCVTWIIPIVGGFFALRCWWNEAELHDIEGTCPACDAEGIKVQGGQVIGANPLTRLCPTCTVKLEVVRAGVETETEQG
jgi:hypothetical protein